MPYRKGPSVEKRWLRVDLPQFGTNYVLYSARRTVICRAANATRLSYFHRLSPPHAGRLHRLLSTPPLDQIVLTVVPIYSV